SEGGLPACGVAENLAKGSIATPGGLLGLWIDSPGHRANLERPGVRTYGIGLACPGDGDEVRSTSIAELLTPGGGAKAGAEAEDEPTLPAPARRVFVQVLALGC
ncbi:MAG: hypothetical protein AAFU61_14440, partial [Pseudomonadota bacterium]